MTTAARTKEATALDLRDRLDTIIDETNRLLEAAPKGTERRTALLYARGDLRNARGEMHYMATCLDKDQAAG